MTLVYFDASAYLKLVVEEAGSELAATLWDGCDAALSSRLAYPEVCAALAAANRANRLGLEELGLAQAAWEEYWAATRVVELTEAVSRRAGELAGQHALRGADAVHLASVLAVGGTDTIFAAWDHRLRTGAQSAGVRLAPLA